MNIEAFYEDNEARRESAEYEFGDEWTDLAGNHYELGWIEATGELYLMIEPEAQVTEDAFGDFITAHTPVEELEVSVIATVGSLDALDSRLEGWEEAMEQENSLAWLARVFPPLTN